MRTVELPSGEKVPCLGQGTWHMGENTRERKREADALRAGLDLGLTLIDTAEMYGDGGAEEVVADAISNRRDEVFLVSKVYPQNASRSGTPAACERSLKRLATDRIDLYLLHWAGDIPLAETVEAFEKLKAAGKIRHWGVSNLDMGELRDLASQQNGPNCAASQVLYHLGQRGIEFDMLPHCAANDIAVMAYSPLAQGAILGNPTLSKVAARHAVSPAALAVAWTLRHPNMISIPKTSSIDRIAENAKAATVVLTPQDLSELDSAFPPPQSAQPLAML